MKKELSYILLADDDKDDRDFFRDAFEGIKIDNVLKFVNDGYELIEYLKVPTIQVPHILFLDLNMPRKNGIRCLEEIKQMPHLKDMSIAIYSTSSSEKDIEETFIKGANIYIKKPSDFEKLKKILNSVIKLNWQFHSENLSKQNFILRI